MLLYCCVSSISWLSSLLMLYFIFFCLDFLDYCPWWKNWPKSFQAYKAIGLWWYWKVLAIVVFYFKAECSSLLMPLFFLFLFPFYKYWFAYSCFGKPMLMNAIDLQVWWKQFNSNFYFKVYESFIVEKVFMLLVAVFIWLNWRAQVNSMLWRQWTSLWCWTATRSDT